jgi:hypothetical protein
MLIAPRSHRVIPQNLRITALYHELKAMMGERYNRNNTSDGDGFVLSLPFGHRNSPITGVVNFDTFIQNYLKDDDAIENLINELLYQRAAMTPGGPALWEAYPVWIAHWVEMCLDDHSRGECTLDLATIQIVHMNISQFTVLSMAITDWLEETLSNQGYGYATHVTFTPNAVYVQYGWSTHGAFSHT